MSLGEPPRFVALSLTPAWEALTGAMTVAGYLRGTDACTQVSSSRAHTPDEFR